MLTGYIRLVSVLLSVISLIFVGTLIMQYRDTANKNDHGVSKYYRIQTLLIMIMHGLSFVVLINTYDFRREILLLFVGEIALLFLSNLIIEHLFDRSLMPLWSISQYLLVISFVIMARLDIELGMKQFYLASAGYLLAFLVAFIYHKLNFIKYLGFPAILIAMGVLVMTNSTINGATNWLQIGNFTFQPSEPAKLLYILFLASTFVLIPNIKNRTIVITGLFTVALIFIQVFQKDLGSALIYYVVFILMCYFLLRQTVL